tara:strand:- start:199 stop:360 length:162 start_codon:yes stop_codon:yes gene_type:complete
MMTRKHFIRIASILNESDAHIDLIEKFADYFSELNPNFNYQKFLDASTGDLFK